MKLEYDTAIRTTTVTQRHDTCHIQQIDWDGYDFDNPEHTQSMGCNAATKTEVVERQKQFLRMCEAHAATGLAQATSDGGSPKFGYGKVLAVGMVSKWPYWEPRPCVLKVSTLGLEWVDWWSITGVEIQPEKSES